ncbi:MAG TPA: hypothetical protein RMH85_08540 [Polyangiaceae bacterium LLY-WYZ-15_(1-7)]|nr:hypothetical protein [Myxococcales bacterium]MBJ72320.1 hypothetical protein [Sandaracinus sp.]HJK89805.1 hypothetical protein [Polyangiaceae bacterium LLY-WYZ-15_(1-7)]HJL01451.1 hypothetical protein [Polyangiaceae bacterium LLY-WYZ-15_(1-7)]HJL08530.1 hypothetical protein [Polyangiaceae bacterium LLY-WYZ-15_(1-7)]
MSSEPEADPDPSAAPRPAPPARVALCLDCRTLLAASERCDVDAGHRVARLDEDAGREAALGEAYGRPPKPTRLGLALKVALAIAWPIGALVLIRLAGLRALLVVGLFGLAFLAWRLARRANERFFGADVAPPPFPADAPRHPGRVGPGQPVRVGPFEDALGGELRLYAGDVVRAVTLRDGYTGGFQLALDDGRDVFVPAGRVRLEAPSEAWHALRAWELDDAQRAADPRDEAPTPFPAKSGAVALLAEGTHVELLGELKLHEEDAAEGYRDAPELHLVPLDRIPRLRLLS